MYCSYSIWVYRSFSPRVPALPGHVTLVVPNSLTPQADVVEAPEASHGKGSVRVAGFVMAATPPNNDVG